MRAAARHTPPLTPAVVDGLDLAALEPGRTHRLWVRLLEDAAGLPVQAPVIVVRGAAPGPVVGITAAIHGNEVNGIAAIHRVLTTFGPEDMKGTLVAVPVVNLPAYLAHQRDLPSGDDLNRLLPGKEQGTFGEVYAHALLQRIVRHVEVLFDLHTASFGRVNSLYIRADMSKPVTADLARVLRPQIIVDNPRGDGTLRGAAEALGIHALTVEIGDPSTFQGEMIHTSRIALRDGLEHLGLLAADSEQAQGDPILCKRSFWLRTDAGGLLEVLPGLCERVTRGQRVARLTNVWGDVTHEYEAPEDGVVVGKSTNPVAHTGARILHLGVLA